MCKDSTRQGFHVRWTCNPPEDPILKKINTGFYFQSQLNLKKNNPEIDIFQYSRLVMLTNLDQYWRSIWINIFVVNFKTDQ